MDPRLTALVDTIVPRDDFPSGSEAGADAFVAAALDRDFAASAPTVAIALDLLDAESRERTGRAFADADETSRTEVFADVVEGRTRVDWTVDPHAFADLMIRLTMQGFLADPGNGGNRDAVSWDMVGYRTLAPGVTWPEPRNAPPPRATLGTLRPRYDAVVVGSGAGGGVAAGVLAEAGLSVLLVERGEWLEPAELRLDHLRSERLQTGRRALADLPLADHPRVVGDGEVVDVTDDRYGNNASTIGGGTRVYGAQAWRFSTEDFRMASTYGVPDGSSLADWPIAYDDLEPDYDRSEWELGVAGDPEGNRFAGRRERGYPMPAFTGGAMRQVLSGGATATGLATSPVPLLINSVPYNGRGACLRCGACVGHGCPGDFKNDSRNTLIERAIASGNCDVLTGVAAERIRTDAGGRVIGVALVAEEGGAVVHRDVDADEVLLGGGAVETPRLLLNSTSDREPHGLGNGSDQVGRNLQAHVYAGAVGIFADPVQDDLGPGPGIATNDYRHHNAGVVGGAMLANDFVPMPLYTWDLATRLGAIPAWGLAGKQGIRRVYPRLAMVMGPVQEVPNPRSRVTVDPTVLDRLGVPVARLTGAVHPEDPRTAQFVSDRAVEWVRASGATEVYPLMGIPRGPSVGQHQAGTCRMGADPLTSVTDEWGRVWGHDNLRIVDASLHVTNGGVNPVLTILALAFRVSRNLVTERAAR